MTDAAGILLTAEVALDSQVSHAEAKDRQLVQTRADVLRKGQQVRQPVQLPVQPIPVALRRVRFNLISAQDLLSAEQMERKCLSINVMME